MMDAQIIARALGGQSHGNRVSAPGPGHSKGDRSLSVLVDHHAPDGFVVWSFAGDSPIACRDYVRAALGLPAFDGRRSEVRHKPRHRPAAPVANKADTIAPALAIWRQSTDPAETVVEGYLRSRGLSLRGATDIRFHGRLRFNGGTVPGMVALMRDIRSNEPCGIQRTFLDAEGRRLRNPQGEKLRPKALGRAKSACVKLAEDAEVTSGLGIAEGVETALAVMATGWRPVWACLSAGTVAAFPVLDGIERLTVFADRDENRAGERAAKECCARWYRAGFRADAIQPDFSGDWNDALEVLL